MFRLPKQKLIELFTNLMINDCKNVDKDPDAIKRILQDSLVLKYLNEAPNYSEMEICSEVLQNVRGLSSEYREQFKINEDCAEYFINNLWPKIKRFNI